VRWLTATDAVEAAVQCSSASHNQSTVQSANQSINQNAFIQCERIRGAETGPPPGFHVQYQISVFK